MLFASLSALHTYIPLGDMLYKIKEVRTIWHL